MPRTLTLTQEDLDRETGHVEVLNEVDRLLLVFDDSPSADSAALADGIGAGEPDWGRARLVTPAEWVELSLAAVLGTA